MTHRCDALLVGAGIMGATLARLLRQLDPDLEVVVLERREDELHREPGLDGEPEPPAPVGPHERAVVGIQSSSGYEEGRPRDTSW